MFTKFKLLCFCISFCCWLPRCSLVAAVAVSRSSLFEPALDQSALESAYADQVPAESKWITSTPRKMVWLALLLWPLLLLVTRFPAESKLDYRYAAQNGGFAAQSSPSGEYTLDFWYARQNGYDLMGE